MLENLRKDISNLEQFNWDDTLQKIVEDNRDHLADFQAKQMAKGVDGKGEPTTLDGSGYTPYTMDLKQKYGKGLGSVVDRVTGYNTGELYRTLEAAISNGQFTLSSPVEYFGALVGRTGAQWVELNEETRLDFAENITLPQTRKRYKEKTGFIF